MQKLQEQAIKLVHARRDNRELSPNAAIIQIKRLFAIPTITQRGRRGFRDEGDKNIGTDHVAPVKFCYNATCAAVVALAHSTDSKAAQRAFGQWYFAVVSRLGSRAVPAPITSTMCTPRAGKMK